MPPPHQRHFECLERRTESIWRSSPNKQKLSSLGLSTHMCEPKKLEGLRLPLTTFCASLGCEQPKHEQACLFGVQLQEEAPQSPTEFPKEVPRVCFFLKSNNEVVGVPHGDDLAAGMPLPPLLDPQIDGVVQIDVRKERRYRRPLRSTYQTTLDFPILQHTRGHPFLDEPQDPLVRDSVLDELHHPSVVDGIEETTDVCIENIIHLLEMDPSIKCIQRIVLAAPRPKPIRESEKVHLVDGASRSLPSLLLASDS